MAERSSQAAPLRRGVVLTVLAVLAPAAHADLPPAHHAEPATVAQWAEGARVFDGLGDFHRRITTSSLLAQRYFDQGMRWLWAFNHDEATRSFAEAAQLDPSCASCYWGLALALGPNYNFSQMNAAHAQLAWQGLHQAQENAPHASSVEQGLIGALAARYPTPQPIGPSNLDAVLAAYAAAMLEVAQHFPDDLDVQTLCAEAQMNIHAWKLWTADGTPVEGTLDIEARLESVLSRDPNHPGANHYYIHVMEASPHPEKALASAERLRGMMPAAGHLEHMPAHIMQRVGRYEEAAEANRRGAAADQAYLEATAPPGDYAMYLSHNYSFLAYSAAMEGRKQETLGAVQSLVDRVPGHVALAMGSTGWNLTQQYAALVRFGLWDEMIALGPPDARIKGLTAGYLYGRGVALAARGRLEDARSDLAALAALACALPANQDFLKGLVAVAQPIVAARIAASDGHSNEAVGFLEEAVAAEDRIGYDEPADWFFPARHLLGAQLLIAGRAGQAERVYREDLKRNPANGWALYGLAAALRAQGKRREAAQVAAEFERAWQHADVPLQGSAFWFAGPDTTSCECQRTPSAHR